MKKLLALALAMGLCVGCAKDRTPDDYCREQVDKQIARIQAAGGTFEGKVRSNLNGAFMGTLRVEIAPDLRPGDMKSCQQSQLQTGVVGRVRLVSDQVQDVAYAGGAYNDANGAFATEIPIELADKSKKNLSLSGIVRDGVFTGELGVEAYPDAAGSFTLKRTGPVVAGLPQAVISGSGSPSGTSIRSLSGLMHYTDGTEAKMTMLIQATESNDEQELLARFLPVRLVTVSIQLMADVQATFTNIKWDQRSGRMRGESAVKAALSADGKEIFQLKLDCFEPAGAPGSWSCQYFDADKGLIFTGVFAPQSP